MLGIFGVSNVGLMGFRAALRKVVSDDELATYMPTVLMFDHTLDDVSQMKGVLLVPTLARLLKFRDILAKRPVIVIVFDTAISLEYIPEIEILDVAEKIQTHKFVFRPIDYQGLLRKIQKAKAAKQHVEIKESDILLIPRMLESTQSSLLSPILNYIYTLKDMNQRHTAQVSLFRWMKEGQVDKFPVLPESSGSKKLLSFLSVESTRNLITAVQEMVKGVAPDKLSKKYDVAAFDLRYIRAQFSKLGIK